MAPKSKSRSSRKSGDGYRSHRNKSSKKPSRRTVIDVTGDVIVEEDVEMVNVSRPRSGPTVWKRRPGDRGFNAETTRIMRRRGLFVGDELRTDCKTDDPFAHTRTASWLAGPETPIDRLLVVHRTGSGKTFAMIHILDLYFSDPRPKIVVFPNEDLVRNFYEKMYRTPTQYSAFIETKARRTGKTNTLTFFRDELGMDGQLHRRGQPGELASPLRPMRYSVAGGRQVFPKGGGKPAKPIFKIMWDGKNPFDNKIILMDEVHNLIKPPVGTDKSKLKRLERLRNALYTARNSVIVGLTATPFVTDEQEGRDLLAMIKGKENQNTETNEGFISYFNTLPSSIYPEVRPGGPSKVEAVLVRLKDANLKKYETKVQERGQLSANPLIRDRQLMNLMNYCNMAGYYQRAKNMSKELRSEPTSYATKLEVVVSDVLKHKKKAAILIHHKLGFKALQEVIKGRDPENKHRFAFMPQPKTRKEKEENPILAKFNANDNDRGQNIRVLVLDASEYGEGIDLLGVRYFYMCNPAINYGQYKQWVGRVLRACAYHRLRSSERNVHIAMYIATLPSDEEATADEVVYRELQEEAQRIDRAMRDVFGVKAVDRIVLGHP